MKIEPSAKRSIIVGDVHGCIDELRALLRRCEYGGPEKDRLIFVGDLVDKGPASREVFRHVMELGAECVLGNHDEKHLRWNRWNRKVAAGEAEKNPMKDNGFFWDMDDDEYEFASAMPLFIRLTGGWYVVHAGFEATGKPPSEQPRNVMLRIRDVDGTTGKYSSSGDPAVRAEGAVRWAERWERPDTVVYGHAPGYKVRVDINERFGRCYGIDTGCVHGGFLTAITLQGNIDFHQVRAKKVYAPPYVEGEDYLANSKPFYSTWRPE